MANEGKSALQQQINRIKTNIANAYTECESKNAEMPAVRNSRNLAQTIASIPVGHTDVTTIIGEFAKYNITMELIADDVYKLVVNDYDGTQYKHNYYMGDITGDVVDGITSLYIIDI